MAGALETRAAFIMSTSFPTLTPTLASRLAHLALAGIQREYPNKLDHVLNDERCLRSPRQLHPAFYGCFDWHSAVHAHWMLARLLRLWPEIPEAGQIRAVLDGHLTGENIRAELGYLSRPSTGSFERTYGWAWLLKLAEELRATEIGAAISVAPAGGGARSWALTLGPLTEAFVARYLAYLPKLDYPIRTGVHPNTAFGLAFAHDYATATGHAPLRQLAEQTAIRFFAADSDYPAHLEPGGSDFFSPALMQAALMHRVLPVEGEHGFTAWFHRFLPGAPRGQPANLFTPAHISDRADLQIVHLDGLNLSRAWCMRSIAAHLPSTDPARKVLEQSAAAHLHAALPHMESGHYAGEHWLATFAVLALTDPPRAH